MNAKEELKEEIIIYANPKRIVDNDHKKILGNIKRKYRVILIYLLCISLILIIMILPVVIAALLQNLSF